MILFDGVLALLIVVLAWRCVTAGDLYLGIVVFIVMGLMLALSWARLDAPDLALAEAAIGAGLLGVLLLSTWRALPGHRRQDRDHPPARKAVRWLAGVASVAFGLVMAALLHALQPDEDAAGALALGRLTEAGVEQPVTAVLLNFRSYDTLLEMGVLLMALIGALLARTPLAPYGAATDDGTDSPLIPVLATTFTPLLLLVGAFLVWAGAYGPGGAFQGGAVLGGAGVVLVLCNRLQGAPEAGILLRLLLVLGVKVFILAGLLMLPLEGAFMAYPPGLTYPIMIAIEFCLATSIAVSLLLLFTGTHGVRVPER